MHVFRQFLIMSVIKIFSTLIAQTQKCFLYFRHKLKSIMCHSKRILDKKSILPSPIQFSINELLYVYNKCKENLYL